MDLAREPKETACARCSTPFDSTQKDHLVSKACEVYFSSLDDLIAVEEGDRICSLCYTAFRRHTMRQSKEQDEKKKICACCKKKSAGAADASPGSRMCRNCYDVVRMRAVRAAHSASGLQQATKPRKSREHRLSFSKCDNDGNVIVVTSRRKRKGTLAYGGIAKQASPREESSLSPKASPSTFAESISLVSSLSAAFASGPSPLEGSPSLSVVNSASGESDSHSTDIWAHDTSPLYTHDAQGFEWPSSVTATPVRPQLSISDVLIGERSYSTPTSVLSQVSPQSPSLVGTPSSRVITQNDFVVRDSPLTRSRCDLTDTRVATRIHTKARLANSDTTTTLVDTQEWIDLCLQKPCSKCHSYPCELRRQTTRGLQSTAVTYCGSCGHTAEHFSSSRYDGLSGNAGAVINVLMVLSTLFSALNWSCVDVFLSVLGVVGTLSEAQFYTLQRTVCAAIVVCGKRSVSRALSECISHAKSLDLKKLMCCFDGAWGHRRHSDCHWGTMLCDTHPPSFAVSPVIAFIYLAKPRKRKRQNSSGQSTVHVLREGTVTGSSQSMEHHGFRQVLAQVSPALKEAKLKADLVMDGDLSNRNTVLSSDIVDEHFLDLGHKSKNIGLGVSKDPNFKNFADVAERWYKSSVYTARAKGWSESEQQVHFSRLADHLSGHHEHCSSESICHSSEYVLSEPNLMSASLTKVALFRALLIKLATLSNGDKIVTEASTCHNESFNALVLKFCPKHMDFTASGEARAYLAVLYHNEGMKQALLSILEELRLPVNSGVMDKVGKIALAHVQHVEHGRQKCAMEKKEREQSVREQRELQQPTPWQEDPYAEKYKHGSGGFVGVPRHDAAARVFARLIPNYRFLEKCATCRLAPVSPKHVNLCGVCAFEAMSKDFE